MTDASLLPQQNGEMPDLPAPGAACAYLAAALLAATGCRGAGDRSTAAQGDWYDVVSDAPGPEVTDVAMRRRLESSGHPRRVRDRATGIELVLVLPGALLMGSPEDEPGRSGDEGPQHRVLLTRAFYLGATEVTQGQWRRVTGEDRGFFPDDRKPADGSWDDLQSFLARANDGLPAEIEPLRAPTEGEWEYACRAGTGGPFAFDAPVGHGLVNHNDGVVDTPYVDGALRVVDGRLGVAWEAPPSAGCRMTTVAAGSLPPNPWGLHEMHGNLWEWTADGYSTSTYARRGATAVDPFERPEAGGTRTLRGGSWYGNARFSRSAARDRGAPSTRSNRIGFRVARTL